MISNHDLELIARKDVAEFHFEHSKEYINANLFQYYTGANSWILVVKGYSEVAAKILEDEIRSRGLVVTIRNAQVAADELVRDQPISNCFALICRGLTTPDALQCLRFLKRFSIVSVDLEAAAKEKLLATNNRIKLINRRCDTDHEFIIDLVRREAQYLFHGYVSPTNDFPRLTNGASFGGSHTAAEKCCEWVNPSFGSPLYPSHRMYTQQSFRFNRISWGTYTGKMFADVPFQRSRFGTVPKNWKGYRTIAIESVTQQSEQQGIRAALEKALKYTVGDQAPIHNQAINGIQASREGFATLDLSSASDSMSFWLLSRILPRKVWDDIRSARSWWLTFEPDRKGEIGGCLIHMVCTMGCGFCFALETGVFLAIARAAVKLVCRHTDRVFSSSLVFAYGDDIIVPEWAYDTVVEFLELLGFIVNVDKSFTGLTPFRESCGYDWFDNEPVSSTYWPRKVIQENYDSLPSLVSLQNRLFERGGGYQLFEAQTFVRNQCKRIAPNLSEVPLDTFLEYSLEGKALVSLTPQPLKWERYQRREKYDRERHGLAAFSQVRDGTLVVYEEDRLYANLVTAKYKAVKYDEEVYRNYRYAKFLLDGPEYDSDIERELGVTSSLWKTSERRKPSGFTISRTRLI
jgi:hypothetical protein